MEKLPPNAWKPFGNGQRACIGRPFAMQEAQLVMSMILQRFDLIEEDPSYQLWSAETLTLKPRRLPHPRQAARRRPRRSCAAGGAVAAKPAAPAGAAPRHRRHGDAAARAVRLEHRFGRGVRPAHRERRERKAIAASSAPLDEHAGALPTDGAVVVVTASYEGQPPDNARQFCAWLESQTAGALKGVRYAVFGCGNRNGRAPTRRSRSASTRRSRRRARPGSRSAARPMPAAISSARSTSWYGALWGDLGRALGKEVQAAPTGGQLQVEVVKAGRTAILRLGDLEHGEVVENRELVDMASPLGRSKRHIDIALPEGMSYRAGDYLAVLPHNPIGVVMRALSASTSPPTARSSSRKPESSITSLPVGYPVNVSELLFNYVELASRQRAARSARSPPRRAAPRRRPSSRSWPRRAATSATCSASGSACSSCSSASRRANSASRAFLEMLPPARRASTRSRHRRSGTRRAAR